MIRLIENEEIAKLAAFCENDAVGVRISSLLLTYGLEVDFVTFWVQVIDGEYAGAVSKFSGDLTVFVTEKTDKTELKEFLSFCSYTSVLMKSEFFAHLDITYTEKGDILEFNEKRQTEPDTPVVKNIEPLSTFSLLQSNAGKSIVLAEYLPWLSDYTYRRHRGRIRNFGIENDGTLVSSAMTIAESENMALLGGVVTNENFRCRGYARRVIYSLVDELKRIGKSRIFIYTYEEKNTVLYSNMGFVKIGEWGKATKNK